MDSTNGRLSTMEEEEQEDGLGFGGVKGGGKGGR